MKVIELMPLKGVEAIEFTLYFGSYLYNDVTVMDCGCMYFQIDDHTIQYLSHCLTHSLKHHAYKLFAEKEYARFGWCFP